MKFICFIFLSIVFLTFSPNGIQAAPGDLDPTFGVGGKIFQNNGFSIGVTSAAVQPDNKIVVAGGFFFHVLHRTVWQIRVLETAVT